MLNKIASKPVSIFWHVFAFIVGLTVEIDYEFIGTLRVSELILLACLCLMAVFGRIPTLFSIPYSKTLASCGLLWLCAQYLSDTVNDTSHINFLKGHAMIGMILVSVAAFVLLFQGDPNRYFSYLTGLFFSRLYDAFLGTIDDFTSQEYWDRFIAGWIGPFLILLSLVLLRRKTRPAIISLLLIAYGCIAIPFAARSHGLIFIFTGVGFWYGCNGLADGLRAVRQKQVIWGAIACGIAFLITFQVYVYFGLRGDLGAGSRHQLRASRNPHNPVSVLVAGRGSIPIAIRAISDRPWVGHGSRAYNQKYINAHTRARGIKMIPAHSCILSAWVFSGILSFPFWLAVLIIHFRLFVVAVNRGHFQFILLSTFLLSEGLWHLWFSPLGYARFPWPPLLAVNIILYNQLLLREQSEAASNVFSPEVDDDSMAEGTQRLAV